MDILVLFILLAVILSQSALLYFILQKHNEEKKILLNYQKDLTDKLYFTKTNDFITNKILQDEPKKTEADNHGAKEEEMIPLENVPLDTLVEAYGGKVK